jgi:hypothetical protein
MIVGMVCMYVTFLLITKQGTRQYTHNTEEHTQTNELHNAKYYEMPDQRERERRGRWEQWQYPIFS